MHPGSYPTPPSSPVPSPKRSSRLWTPLALMMAGILATLPVTSHGAETVRISTLPGLRFDTSAFSVKPGTEVEVVFSNYDEMLHNFVIVKPGARQAVVQAALILGAGAAERSFVPVTPDVLFSSKVVPAGSSYSLKFTAPTTLGEYPYVCTFPGHGLLMFGTMIVTDNPQPPVMTPPTPPKPVTSGSAPGSPGAMPALGSSSPGRATTMRAFMPDAGPATIAVQLPGGVSYCWDAGAGRFRYAWTGGYMTMPPAAERGLATIQGEVFYREPSYPLRVATSPEASLKVEYRMDLDGAGRLVIIPGSEPKQIDFKGYTIDAQRIPEFETIVDGVRVLERAEVKDGKLVRRFRTTGAATVWFYVPPEARGSFAVSGGTKDGAAFYKFAGPEAQEFTITLPLPKK